MPTTIFFVFLLAISFVSAVEVIQREQPAPAKPGVMSPLQGVVDFLMAWWLPLAIIALAFVGLMFIMKWLKSKQEKDNIFLKDYNQTITLCKMGRNPKRVKQRSFWLVILTVSLFVSMLLLVIALVMNDVSTFLLAIGIFIAGFLISLVFRFSGFLAHHDAFIIAGKNAVKVVGNYIGECVTADGYRNFMLWNSRKYVFWKNVFIIKVNMNDKIRIETVDKEGARAVVTHELPIDLILEGDSLIVVKGEGVDKAGYFYYPLLADVNGNIINMDLFAYARARDTALITTMYQQTEDFSKVQRSAINMNPNVRYIMKTKGDTIAGAEGEGGG
jgi:hypothetical protein